MGNFHCVSSSCATVVYREYKPPVVRWQYPGEEWNEIEGDDYEITPSVLPNQEPDKAYEIRGKIRVNGRMPPQLTVPAVYAHLQEIEIRALGSWTAPIYNDFEPDLSASNVQVRFSYTARQGNNPTVRPCVKTTTSRTIYDLGGKAVRNGSSTASNPGFYVPTGIYDIQLIEVPFDVKPCSNNLPVNCIFKVLSDGAVVHEETRADCPEVEILPCRLSDEFKQIKIDKLPYLDRVEVVDYEIIKFGLNVFRGSIPPECLNIYRNDVIGVIPLEGGIPLPFTYQSWDLIEQICSAPGCPPPEYDVVCECEPCESCPDGTCPIECGGVICCYGSDGVAVKSIPIGSYCDG